MTCGPPHKNVWGPHTNQHLVQIFLKEVRGQHLMIHHHLMGDEEPPSVDPHLLLKIYVPEFDFLGGSPHALQKKLET